ncbi:NACHT domain-containing protein [Lentzea nigeriaca]|uniref:NACHT domain-containing protein n=1 Tax=Lentzea nigeriaca TaxID=1128665 RepID=UPI00195A4C9C|nr:NACHT domain-containing protein [Lentzea nigeriaca]MBM7859347.1 hypothetical protein [Lentzea nigeriaca]
MGKILGLLGAALVPPGLAFTFLQEWAKAHPVAALVLLAGYEAVVWASAFVGRIMGGVADELGKRWQPRLTDRIDQSLRQRFSRFSKRYRESVLSGLRFIDLKGLATIGFYTPDLDEVFVDVSLVFRAPNQVRGDVLAQAPEDVDERHSIWNLLDQQRPVVLAVVGAPGSGKTTLLRYTARRMCRSRRGRRRTVPVLLYLRDHVTAITADPTVALPELIATPLVPHGLDAPPGWFERRLSDGDCVVLLDGLDEVASQEDRTRVATWVASQTKRYPHNDFVVTSRPHGYQTARVDGATVLQVRSFTDAQVGQFIHGWYLAIEQRSTGSADEDVRRRAAESAEDLLQRLEHTPALHDLTINPLLLTMIANVHRFRGALPGIRADLYGEICQVLLWRRHDAKGLMSELNGDQKAVLLRGLAYAMMRRRVRDLPRDEMLVELRPALRRMSRTISEEDFLAEAGSNGLLLERESNLYSFAHLTFQEYLAAEHIREKGLGDVLTKTVEDVWWRETTLLYVARSDADAIVEACTASGSVAALSLAFDCAEQSTELAPELRAKLDDLLSQTLDADVPDAVRRLMTGVQLTRHLRHAVVRTGNGTRMCTQPITPDIYRRFLADTGREDQWLGALPSFTNWVNEITNTEARYRVPTYDEVRHPVVCRALKGRSAWYSSAAVGVQMRLWTPDGAESPHTITLATIREHVLTDLTKTTPLIVRTLLLYALNASFHERARDVVPVLARAMALDRALPSTLTSAGDDLSRRITAAIEGMPDHPIFRFMPAQRDNFWLHTLDPVLGRGLHAAAKAASSGRSGDTVTSFADGLLAESRAVGDTVEPFAMAPPDRPQPVGSDTSWQRLWGTPAKRLTDDLRPHFALEKALTPELATEFRLAALCHAAEFGTKDYRALAAKITFLERHGQDEALVLAVT